MKRIHPVVPLRANSRYVRDGEHCPVCRRPLQPGDEVVVCDDSDVAVMFRCWYDLESAWKGICQYCGQSVILSRPRAPLPPPPPNGESTGGRRNTLFGLLMTGGIVLGLAVTFALDVLIEGRGPTTANLESASFDVTSPLVGDVGEVEAVRSVTPTLVAVLRQECSTPTFYHTLFDSHSNLGCPVNAWESDLAYQWFERGLVVWPNSSGFSKVYVLYKGDGWRSLTELTGAPMDQLGLPMTGVMVAKNSPVEQFQNGLTFQLGQSGYILFGDNQWKSFLSVGDSLYFSP
jgi:hypothetical protein